MSCRHKFSMNSSTIAKANIFLFSLFALFSIQITCLPNPKPQPPMMTTRVSTSAGAIPSPYRQRLPALSKNKDPDCDVEDDYRSDPEIPGPEPPLSVEMNLDEDDNPKRRGQEVTQRSKPKNSERQRPKSQGRNRDPHLENSDPVTRNDPDTTENNLSEEHVQSSKGRKNTSKGQGRGQNKGQSSDEDENDEDRQESSHESDDGNDEETWKGNIRSRTDYEGRYVPDNSHEGQTDPRGHVSGYPGIEQPMYAHPDDYREDHDDDQEETPSKKGGSPSLATVPDANEDRSMENLPKKSKNGEQDTYDATYNSNHNWKVQDPSPETKIDFSPFPGFSRPCQSYFDCDFQPSEQKNRPPQAHQDNSKSTWFSCDGRYCTCELFGFARDDEANWRVKWSPKSKQCVAEVDGPCGRSDGLHIYCQLGYECVDNICEKIGKPRPKKPKPGDDCDDDKSKDSGVNLFSVLFFPKNIVDSILNDTLGAATGSGGKMNNNYNSF